MLRIIYCVTYCQFYLRIKTSTGMGLCQYSVCILELTIIATFFGKMNNSQTSNTLKAHFYVIIL